MKMVIIILITLFFLVFSVISVDAATTEQDSRLVGYESLDNNTVIHIWNEIDDYYFDSTSGMQFSNHHNEYWTHNIFCGGFKHPVDGWLYDCVDELPFNLTIEADNLTYVNLTGWRTKTVSGRTIRYALRYHLASNDTNLTIVMEVKNVGSLDIPYDLGFAWRVNDIQIDNTIENDKIVINNTEYQLNDTLNLTFTNMTESIYTMYDTLTYEYLWLQWNKNLNYRVVVESKPGQYNAPTTLGINIGTLNIGQTKRTTMYWIDATMMSDDAPPDVNTTSLTVGEQITVQGHWQGAGGGGTWSGDMWIADDGTRITNSDTGKDFYCPDGASNVNVDLCECSSCTPNADCSITVSACGNKNNVDITFTLTGSGNEESLPSSNLFRAAATTGTFDQDSATVTLSSDAPPPIWNTDLAVNDSQVTAKEHLNYTGTGDTTGSLDYYMTVCKTDSITAAFPGTCEASQTICTSAQASDIVQASCDYTTLIADIGTFTSFGFVCDSGSMCSASTNAVTDIWAIYGSINQSTTAPSNGTNVTQNESLNMNATACCVHPDSDATCGIVTAYALYNGSSGVDTLINNTFDIPFYITEPASGSEGLSLISQFELATANNDPHGPGLNETHMWVAQWSPTSVYMYLLNSTFLDSWSLSGFVVQPIGLGRGTSDFIWVADFSDDDVHKFSPSGTHLDEWSLNEQGNTVPTGVTSNGSDVWTIDDSKEVYRWLSDGTFVGSWTATEVIGPSEITTNGEYLWLITGTTDEIGQYEMDGTFVELLNITQFEIRNGVGVGTFDGDFLWAINRSSDVYKLSQGSPFVYPSQTLNANECIYANFTINATGINDTQYRVGIKFNSSIGEGNISSNQTEDRLVCIGDCPTGAPPAPSVSVVLNEPATATNFNPNMSNMLFNYTATYSGAELLNCTMWDNMSGTWDTNQSNQSTITSGSKSTMDVPLSFITPGSYIWNTVCYIDGVSDWGDTNFTFTITEAAADSCSCPGAGIDHTFDLVDACVVSSCLAKDIGFAGTGSPVGCTGIWNIRNLITNVSEWLVNTSSSCFINNTQP